KVLERNLGRLANPRALRSKLGMQLDFARRRGGAPINGLERLWHEWAKQREAWELEGDVGCFGVDMVLVIHSELAPRPGHGSANMRPAEVGGYILYVEVHPNVLVEPRLCASCAGDAAPVQLGSDEVGAAGPECRAEDRSG